MIAVDNFTGTSTAWSDAIAQRVAARVGVITTLADVREPPWVISVQRQIAELQRLERGWDGFQAGPIRRDVLEYARRLLETVMMDDTPAPQITPMSHDGVLIEWHIGGIDLEIEIEIPGEAWVAYGEDGSEDSWPLKSDFRSLSGPIEEISRRYAARGAS